jgi:signal transduction histidine kinase
MRYGDDALVVQVDSHGGASAPSSPTDLGGGRGLIGMRERAQALRGSLRAGPRADGGFRVHARLPYEATP